MVLVDKEWKPCIGVVLVDKEWKPCVGVDAALEQSGLPFCARMVLLQSDGHVQHYMCHARNTFSKSLAMCLTSFWSKTNSAAMI